MNNTSQEKNELCKSILEKIDKIKKTKYNKTIDAELNKFSNVFSHIMTTSLTVKEFKDYIRENTTKAIHYDHYKENPILVILHIYLSELNLLYDYITYYNSINIKYTKKYKILWKKIIDEKYDLICNNFIGQLPCIEGYINDLEKELNFMKEEPLEPVDMEVKLILSKDDFNNDGGFSKRVKNNMQDWEIIGLTISTFRISICGTYYNCNADDDTIRNSYNLSNYKTYLEYLDFYDKFPNINEELVMLIIEDAGGIDSSYDVVQKGKMCCLKDLVGGRKKKRTLKKKKFN